VYIDAGCFPAMIWGKLRKMSVTVLLWHHVRSKIVIIRTFPNN